MKLRTKAGLLTPFAFACGYIQEYEYNNIRTSLEKDGYYQVRQFNHDRSKRLYWEQFSKLTEARKAYNTLVKISHNYKHKS